MAGKLAILGLGLMGGSLGLAVSRRRTFEHVCGYARREETRQRALALGVIDSAAVTPAQAVQEADMCVACVPVATIPGLLEACGPSWKAGCAITDVGSTKAWLASEAAAVADRYGAVFVGSHPICGSEQTGIDAARAGLYQGSVTVVTPQPQRQDEPAYTAIVRAIESLWLGVGSHVMYTTPEQHDRRVAATSHLPHLLAAGLVRLVLNDRDDTLCDFCGSGFRDTSRVAAGSPEMWLDILQTNREAIAASMAAFGAEWSELTDRVRAGDREALRAYLAAARDARNALDFRGVVKSQGEANE